MVAVDAQILGGVAVTVLLALLFFGVVVLWDVALAIRGVADKLDKLEDTVDDDLTDMERAVSGAPGGGGPQVHLSGGGTITSGGSARTQTGPHPSPRPDSPTGDPATDRRSAHAEGARSEPTDAARAESADAARATSSSTTREQMGSNEATDTESQANSADHEPRRSRQSVGADPTPVRSAAETAEWSASGAEEVAGAETAVGDDGPTASTDPTGSDSSPNSGRFITSPDRTPWYRTRLDWDAVADGRSPIAGELEAGDVEPAPTDSDRSETDPADEPIVVDPDGDATTEATARNSQEADERDDEESVETDGTGAIEAGSDRTDDPPSSEDDAEASSGDDGDTEVDDGAERGDSASSTAEPFTSDEAESTETGDSTTETESADSITTESAVTGIDGDDPDVIGAGDDASEIDFDFEASETDESGTAADEIESPDDDSTADRSPNAVEPVPSESDAIERVADEADDRLDEDADTNADEGEDGHLVENDADAQSDGIEETPDMEFTFEEFSPDETSEPSLTVDDAVEAVNEADPSLSRSAHGVTSTAERDDDSVVLVYDLETADAGGSTKRLLTYQLQSFANESDVDVDVSVAGNRIVVDIPDAEGTDVSQWEAAIVEVIDRTLYLSDSS